MRRFPVDTVPGKGGRIALSDPAAHHALEVVHLRAGEVVEVFDGNGRVATARFAEGAWLEVLDEGRIARPGFPLHLLIGIPKGPAMDDAVRDGTEAGATDIHPILVSRSIAKGERVDRWERIDPNRVAVRSQKESGETIELTYGELREEVERLAGALIDLGVSKGDAVAVFLPMSSAAVISLLAIARIGAIFIPVFSGYAAEAVATCIREIGAPTSQRARSMK